MSDRASRKPVGELRTRSLNVRVFDSEYDYLAEQVGRELVPSLSAALRQAILKARLLDEAVRTGKLPEPRVPGDPGFEEDVAFDNDQVAALADDGDEGPS